MLQNQKEAAYEPPPKVRLFGCTSIKASFLMQKYQYTKAVYTEIPN